MKRLISAAVAVMLLVCSLTAFAEDIALGDSLRLDGSRGYTAEYLEDSDCYLILGEDAMFTLSIIDLDLDIEQLILGEELLNILAGDATIEKAYSVVNGIQWIGYEVQTDSMNYKTAMALAENAVFNVIDLIGTDYTHLTALMSALSVDGAAAPQPAAAEDVTWESLSGWYDLMLMGEIDNDINAIITPTGSVLLTNSTGALAPVCALRDNAVVAEDGYEFFTVNADGTLTMLGTTMVKRPDVVGHDEFLGTWVLSSLADGASIANADDLKARNFSMKLIVHANGTIDWYNVSDDEIDDVAMGWFADGETVYLYNGNVETECKLVGDNLSYTLDSSDGSQSVTFTFVRAE